MRVQYERYLYAHNLNILSSSPINQSAVYLAKQKGRAIVVFFSSSSFNFITLSRVSLILLSPAKNECEIVVWRNSKPLDTARLGSEIQFL